MLHNIVVAVALTYSDDRALRERALRDKFISQGKLSSDSECQRPTLSTVQSLDLLPSYYSGMGEQSLGFLDFGSFVDSLPSCCAVEPSFSQCSVWQSDFMSAFPTRTTIELKEIGYTGISSFA